MSIDTQKFISSKKLPDFLTEGLSKYNKIEKIFPKIGIANFNQDIKINIENISIYADNLISALFEEIGNILNSLINLRQKDKKDIYNIAIEHFLKIKVNKNHFIITTKNKFSIFLIKDIYISKKLEYHNGETIFKIYNKLKYIVDNVIYMKSLESFQEFKLFSENNLNNQELYKIIFSSDKIEGAWDLATSSMRGFSSCISWGGEKEKCLIDTIANPYIGIIFLSSNKNTDYGSNMLYRCMVRFVINSNTKKPFLFLEKMYPKYNSNILKSFVDILSSKIKIDILNYENIDYRIINNSYSPKTSCDNFYQDTIFIATKQKSNQNILNSLNYLSNRVAKKAFIIANNNKYFKNINDELIQSPDYKFIIREYYKNIILNQLEYVHHQNFDFKSKLLLHFLSNKIDLKPENIKILNNTINNYYNKSLDLYDTIKYIEPIHKQLSSYIKILTKKIILKRLNK